MLLLLKGLVSGDILCKLWRLARLKDVALLHDAHVERVMVAVCVHLDLNSVFFLPNVSVVSLVPFYVNGLPFESRNYLDFYDCPFYVFYSGNLGLAQTLKDIWIH